MVNRTIEKLLILFNTALSIVLAAWIMLGWVNRPLLLQIREILWDFNITPYKIYILIGIASFMVLSCLFLLFNRLPVIYSSVYVYSYSKKRTKLTVGAINKAAKQAARQFPGIKRVKVKIMLGKYGSQLHIDMKTDKNLDFVEITKDYCTALIVIIKEKFGVKFPSYKFAQGKYAYEYSLPEGMPAESAAKPATVQAGQPVGEVAAQPEAKPEEVSAVKETADPVQSPAQPAQQQPAMAKPEPAPMPEPAPEPQPDLYGQDYAQPADEYFGKEQYAPMENPLDIYADNGPYLNADMNPYMDQPDPLLNDPYMEEYMNNNPYAAYGNVDDLAYDQPHEDELGMPEPQPVSMRMTQPAQPRYTPPVQPVSPAQPVSPMQQTPSAMGMQSMQARPRPKLPIRKGLARTKSKSDIYDRINAIIDKYTKTNGNINK